MQVAIGYILIILGALMEVVAILVWVGIIPHNRIVTLANANVWDVLLELLRRFPWCAIVGLVLIYAGLKMVGISLPF